jgi:hypothetical protein
MSTKEEREMQDLAMKVERDFDDLCHADDLAELDAMSDSLRNTFDKMLKTVCEYKRKRKEGKP